MAKYCLEIVHHADNFFIQSKVSCVLHLDQARLHLQSFDLSLEFFRYHRELFLKLFMHLLISINECLFQLGFMLLLVGFEFIFELENVPILLI